MRTPQLKEKLQRLVELYGHSGFSPPSFHESERINMKDKPKLERNFSFASAHRQLEPSFLKRRASSSKQLMKTVESEPESSKPAKSEEKSKPVPNRNVSICSNCSRNSSIINLDQLSNEQRNKLISTGGLSIKERIDLLKKTNRFEDEEKNTKFLDNKENSDCFEYEIESIHEDKVKISQHVPSSPVAASFGFIAAATKKTRLNETDEKPKLIREEELRISKRRKGRPPLPKNEEAKLSVLAVIPKFTLNDSDGTNNESPTQNNSIDKPTEEEEKVEEKDEDLLNDGSYRRPIRTSVGSVRDQLLELQETKKKESIGEKPMKDDNEKKKVEEQQNNFRSHLEYLKNESSFTPLAESTFCTTQPLKIGNVSKINRMKTNEISTIPIKKCKLGDLEEDDNEEKSSVVSSIDRKCSIDMTTVTIEKNEKNEQLENWLDDTFNRTIQQQDLKNTNTVGEKKKNDDDLNESKLSIKETQTDLLQSIIESCPVLSPLSNSIYTDVIDGDIVRLETLSSTSTDNTGTVTSTTTSNKSSNIYGSLDDDDSSDVIYTLQSYREEMKKRRRKNESKFNKNEVVRQSKNYQNNNNNANKIPKKVKHHRPSVIPITVDSKLVDIDQMIEDLISKIFQTSMAMSQVYVNSNSFIGTPYHIETSRLLLCYCQRQQLLLAEKKRLRQLDGLQLIDPRSSALNYSIIKEAANNRQIKTKEQIPFTSQIMSFPRGSLIISDIRLTLRRDYLERYANNIDPYCYCFICLLSYGTQLLQTQVLTTDNTLQDQSIRFPNRMCFSDVEPQFSIKISVYVLEIKRDHLRKKSSTNNQNENLRIDNTLNHECVTPDRNISKSRLHLFGRSINRFPSKHNTPRKIIDRILGEPNQPKTSLTGFPSPNDFQIKTFKSNSKWKHSKEENGEKLSSFIHVDTIRITPSNLRKKFYKFKVPVKSIPLENTLQVQLQSVMNRTENYDGYLTLFESEKVQNNDTEVISLPWKRLKAQLHSSAMLTLSEIMLSNGENEQNGEMIRIMSLERCINESVTVLPWSRCARSNTFELIIIDESPSLLQENTQKAINEENVSYHRQWFSADTEEECDRWCAILNKSLTDIRTWNPAALNPKNYKHLFR
ncbi:hypothetical protein SNEBB_003927 [Seison nebaliae]|nr:hypothetical protein SNEBB_003927 [Seison nebaliae]